MYVVFSFVIHFVNIKHYCMVSSFLHQPSYAPSNSSLCYFPCTNPPRLKPKSSRVVMLKFFHSKHGKPSTLSCLNRFGSLSSIKGKLQSYSIKRRPIQLCVAKFVATISGRPTYRCDGEVPTNFWPHSVLQIRNAHHCLLVSHEKTENKKKDPCSLCPNILAKVFLC